LIITGRHVTHARDICGGRIMTKHALLAAVAAVTTAVPMTPAGAADPAAIARGKYLVAIAGCNDCHTPGLLPRQA